MIEIDKQKIKYGIIAYGEMQLIVTIEELSELQKELTKVIRKKGNADNLIEELSDVLICCETVKQYFAISDTDIQKIVDRKLERLQSKNVK